jgi:hypothetical protein
MVVLSAISTVEKKLDFAGLPLSVVAVASDRSAPQLAAANRDAIK